MRERVRVSVIAPAGRRYYQLRYRHPQTGKVKTVSSETEQGGRRNRKAAEKEAAVLEADLKAGRLAEPVTTTWEAFRLRYEREQVPSLAPRTGQRIDGVFNTVERTLNPAKLADVTAEKLSFYMAELRRRGSSEATIATHRAHLLAALRWAKSLGLLAEVPTVAKPKRARQQVAMKGRPASGEEFERMLSKVSDALTPKPTKATPKPEPPTRAVVDSWKRLLRGLWTSGLRLGEAMTLHWSRHDRLGVDLEARYPMLRIPAALEKGNRERILPMAPEFAEFLLATPEAERHGPVFDPRPRTDTGGRLTTHHVGRVVSRIGELAGVKVNTCPRTGKVKFASAHDLRRSFGERWAARVMPGTLQELMRHESLDTTMRFYVGRNAERTASQLWAAHAQVTEGNKSGNRAAEPSSANEETPPQANGTTGFKK